ncbi:zinc ribbon domain-containing protein [Nocardia speluncae]|uniref:zinc ribbon domain-containing protein n=1 Tax=Nocardia speluncae TaxID=419477 RepID=UPI0027D805EC|nr:zinc ribbon domain-containing protein [Nocardia speluncae]
MLAEDTIVARAVSEASWARFRMRPAYKSDRYGRNVVAVDRFDPSGKTGSVGGRINDSMPLHVRNPGRPRGAFHDRDVDAAKNTRAAGLAVLACGDGVRPPRN